jgi:hypothetical protein
VRNIAEVSKGGTPKAAAGHWRQPTVSPSATGIGLRRVKENVGPFTVASLHRVSTQGVWLHCLVSYHRFSLALSPRCFAQVDLPLYNEHEAPIKTRERVLQTLSRLQVYSGHVDPRCAWHGL